MFQYYFKYRDTVSYHDIFGSDTQYYYLVVSHIPTNVTHETLTHVSSTSWGRFVIYSGIDFPVRNCAISLENVLQLWWKRS